MSRRGRKGDNGSINVKTDSWLVTYGDLMTLCLTFFVLLYSFSMVDNKKFEAAMSSIQGALGVLDGGPSINDGYPSNSGTPGKDVEAEAASQAAGQVDNMNEYLKYQQEMKKLEGIQSELSSYLQEQGLSSSISVAAEERGLVIRFQDSVLFSKGRADLLPASAEILKEVAVILNSTGNGIRIEGHTDNLPIHTEQFPSNWELSTSRATNVLRFLVQQGMTGEKLSAVGYGEYHPLIPNNDEDSRRKNRRVDIVILRESMQKIEPR